MDGCEGEVVYGVEGIDLAFCGDSQNVSLYDYFEQEIGQIRRIIDRCGSLNIIR